MTKANGRITISVIVGSTRQFTSRPATFWDHFQGGDVEKGSELEKQGNVMIDDLLSTICSVVDGSPESGS